MKKIIVLLTITIMCFTGCQSNTLAQPDDTGTYPEFVMIGDTAFSISQLNAGIQDAFHNTIYYHSRWADGRFTNCLLEYELYFSRNKDPNSPHLVVLLITNVDHPLSRAEEPLQYLFGINITELGMQSDFHIQMHIPAGSNVKDHYYYGFYISETYLGSYSMEINCNEKPIHEEVSEQWKDSAEAAIRLYMEGNDFYSAADGILPQGKYRVYIQGFFPADESADIVFQHEDGRLFIGRYLFVHDINPEERADLNHVAPVADVAYYEDYMNKLQATAVLTMDYEIR